MRALLLCFLFTYPLLSNGCFQVCNSCICGDPVLFQLQDGETDCETSASRPLICPQDCQGNPDWTGVCPTPAEVFDCDTVFQPIIGDVPGLQAGNVGSAPSNVELLNAAGGPGNCAGEFTTAQQSAGASIVRTWDVGHGPVHFEANILVDSQQSSTICKFDVVSDHSEIHDIINVGTGDTVGAAHGAGRMFVGCDCMMGDSAHGRIQSISIACDQPWSLEQGVQCTGTGGSICEFGEKQDKDIFDGCWIDVFDATHAECEAACCAHSECEAYRYNEECPNGGCFQNFGNCILHTSQTTGGAAFQGWFVYPLIRRDVQLDIQCGIYVEGGGKCTSLLREDHITVRPSADEYITVPSPGVLQVNNDGLISFTRYSCISDCCDHECDAVIQFDADTATNKMIGATLTCECFCCHDTGGTVTTPPSTPATIDVTHLCANAQLVCADEYKACEERKCMEGFDKVCPREQSTALSIQEHLRLLRGCYEIFARENQNQQEIIALSQCYLNCVETTASTAPQLLERGAQAETKTARDDSETSSHSRPIRKEELLQSTSSSCYCQSCPNNAQLCTDGCSATNGGCFCDPICEAYNDCCTDSCASCGLNCGGGGGSCFPGNAEVVLESGEVQFLSQLKMGDRVMTASKAGGIEFTDFYGFGFALSEEQVYQFLVIEFIDQHNVTGNVELTDVHFIFRSKSSDVDVNGYQAVEAREVVPGDYVWVQDVEKQFGAARVLSAHHSLNRGKYSPLTLSGTLLVDGALVSCFDDPTGLGLPHEFWQTISYPSRAAYTLAGRPGLVWDGIQALDLSLGHIVTQLSDLIRRSSVYNQFVGIMLVTLIAASVRKFKAY